MDLNFFERSEFLEAMRDPSTVSNNEDMAIRHISLDWTVDFDRKCIHGKALLKCEALKDTDKIVSFQDLLLSPYPFLRSWMDENSQFIMLRLVVQTWIMK